MLIDNQKLQELTLAKIQAKLEQIPLRIPEQELAAPSQRQTATKQLLNSRGATEEVAVDNMLGLASMAQNEGVKLRANELLLKMHGHMNPEHGGLNVTIVNANNANIAQMLGAKE